jgi:hypothetical protein
MIGSAKAVFLSYASQAADAAQRVCDSLRAAGIEVWFDQSNLRGGDAWDSAIRKQVKDCALFVPLISANTESRSEGYFRREWNLAVNRMLDMAEDQSFLLPVVIDDTPEMTARVPDRFRERQWTRLPGGLAANEFAERVARLLESDRATASAASRVARPTAAADPGRSEEGFWIAVLPFKCAGSNADLAVFAEALADEIVTGLCRFSYGARYAIEGSLRQAGSRLRLAMQLVDTVSGSGSAWEFAQELE